MSGVEVPNRMRSSTVNGEAENFRMVMTGPTSDSGGMIALTREPSVRRASTIGDDSSTRRPIGAMIRSMIRMTWSSFWKTTFVSSSLPRALDVDLARAVDHDFRDRLVAEQRLQRAEADDLVGDLLEHPDALGAGQGEAFLVDDLAEDLLDLAPDLDLVGQVELRVEVLDDPALDPELDVAERLADRRLGHQAACGAAGVGASRTAARRRGRNVGTRSGAGPAPGRALSIRFSSDIASHPLPPRGATVRADTIIGTRTATSSDRPCGWPRRASAGRAPATAEARRRMSWETCASRLERKNGTPRLRAYTTLRPSLTIVWSTFRPIELLDVRDADAEVESARLRTSLILSWLVAELLGHLEEEAHVLDARDLEASIVRTMSACVEDRQRRLVERSTGSRR